MSKSSEWVMVFVVLLAGLTASWIAYQSLLVSQDSLRISENSLNISEDSLKISEASLQISNRSTEIAEAVYKLLELEKRPYVSEIDYPETPFTFHSFDRLDFKLKNIGGLITRCDIKLSVENLKCSKTSPEAVVLDYLPACFFGGCKSERDLYQRFLKFDSKNGDDVCEDKDILFESGDKKSFIYYVYMKPSSGDEETSSIELKYSCDNSITKEEVLKVLIKERYLIEREYSDIAYAKFEII